jgi:uncharacterized protein
MSSRCLIIFTRNPEVGRVKSRLASTIGKDQAFEVYKLLLTKTKDVCISIPGVKHVYYDRFIDDSDIWPSKIFQKYLQSGGDLGEKMQKAFQNSFAGGAFKVIIIGSDCPGLTPEIIDKGFKALEHADTVIGPSYDGGYYLLGMKQNLSFLFENVEWGTNKVFKTTKSGIMENNLSVFELPVLRDIDVYEDWLSEKHLL